MQNKKPLAIAYLTQSIKYLELAEEVFGQMVRYGNKHTVVGGGGENKMDDIWKDYHEQTKWSDFNIIFPTLFLFYHGIELMIKGLFPLLGSEIPLGHKSDLLTTLKKQNGVKEEIVNIVDKYLNFDKLKQSPLGDWLQKNKLDVDDLYERLRYPTDKKHSILTNNLPLKYQEEKMIPFAKQIICDSEKLRALFVSQLNEIYPNHT